MGFIKQLVRANFDSLIYFYKQMNYRFFLLVSLNIGVAILDSFGLAMFLPLLELVGNTGEEASGVTLGKLRFIVEIVKNFGINLTVLTVLLVIVIFFVFKGLVKFSAYVYRTNISKYFYIKLRKQLLFAFNNLRYGYFITSDVGRIQNTMSGEVERVSSAFYSYTQTLEQIVLIIVYISFAFFVDFRFTLFVTTGGWLTNFFYKFFYKKTKAASKKFTEASHAYQGQIIQYIGNYKYLKATGYLIKYSEMLQASISSIETSRKRMGIFNAILQAAREPLLIIVVVGVILIQTQVLNSTMGPILISLIFFYRALSSLLSLQNNWNRFMEVSGSLENIKKFQEDLDKNEDDNGEIVHTFNESLELRHATFSYETKCVLKDINLKISKNETIAFIGKSGSGKTTLVNIISGLIPVEKGFMLVDNIDIKKIDLHKYQRRLGYITQEPVIFNDTIYNNVTLWDEPTGENYQRFTEALSKASINEFANELDNKSETLLGNNGINLSGGQKQRISIARELYKNIDVLIMDEATSSLDTETERSIKNSIECIKGKYTILIVAHRLSTIRSADRIVLMNKGRIIAIGSFEELLEGVPSFRRMVELQEI